VIEIIDKELNKSGFFIREVDTADPITVNAMTNQVRQWVGARKDDGLVNIVKVVSTCDFKISVGLRF